MHPDQIKQSIWPKSLVDRCILVVQGQRNQFVIPDLINKSVLLLPGAKKFVEDATCSRIEVVVEGARVRYRISRCRRRVHLSWNFRGCSRQT